MMARVGMLLASAVPSVAVLVQRADFPAKAGVAFTEPGKPLNLQAALADQPPGAYVQFIRPVAEAMSLVYNVTGGPTHVPGEANATIACQGCGTWERLRELDSKPDTGGVHSIALANHETKQAILSFRGTCLDKHFKQCRTDMCFLLKHDPYMDTKKHLSDALLDKECADVPKKKLDYLSQARWRKEMLEGRLPGYNIILTGHSLGGLLATALVAEKPGSAQALTFSPIPFHRMLRKDYNMTEAQIGELPLSDIISLCSPYDCGLATVNRQEARRGSITCLYDEPKPETLLEECKGMKEKIQEPDYALRFNDDLEAFNCSVASHFWLRYRDLAFETVRVNGTSGPSLPACHKEYSIASTRLFRKLGLNMVPKDKFASIRM